ncbi:TerC family protein [Polaromonas sp. SP1]|nr:MULTISPECIES: TerC family protein [unclassified Polaromonas]AYQ30436.1 TerC family protein [Polaromonas sp. SP1]QGJ20686.1 YjbE family putative metal transport protein [Polaromonas sp. Pch-P]
MDLASPLFWSAFGSIMIANIVLSGDNAVVIAMAARTLKPEQQAKAIFWGSAAAIVMRIVLTIVAIQLLTLPYLKIIGAVLLVYIGVDLLKGEEEGDEHGKEINGMAAAIRTILVADLVMSLDNVLAVAAAAKGNLPLLVLGLVVSIPLIVFGATLLTKVMERFPIIITIGAALLGFLAGEMLLTDPAVTAQFGAINEHAVTAGGILGAVLVVALGTYMAKRQQKEASSA